MHDGVLLRDDDFRLFESRDGVLFLEDQGLVGPYDFSFAF
jgi:hypothetical protein